MLTISHAVYRIQRLMASTMLATHNALTNRLLYLWQP